jgi:NAD(P)-dependent dehydrogenase (short-subunit alcohol dehydrogenase family)
MRRFHDKVAIVTGGSSGIGSATARGLAQEGAAVVIASRTAAAGERIAGELVSAGCEATFFQTDVSRADSVSSLIERTIAQYGQLDIIVNNAAVPGGSFPLCDYPESDWDEVMAVNLKGVWLGMKYAIPHFLRNGRGAVVNVASEVGFVGSTFGIAPYVASKHGVIGLTRAAALECAARSIRVNAVCPGLTDTNMIATAKRDHSEFLNRYIEATIPMGRMAMPVEPANAVLWLCSDDASFVTGHALVVDGGILAK